MERRWTLLAIGFSVALNIFLVGFLLAQLWSGHGIPDQLEDVPIVARDQRRYQSLLVGEVLVERADADTGDRGDTIGAGAIVPLPGENASGGVQQRLDHRPGALLGRGFSRDRRDCARHLTSSVNASRQCES